MDRSLAGEVVLRCRKGALLSRPEAASQLTSVLGRRITASQVLAWEQGRAEPDAEVTLACLLGAPRVRARMQELYLDPTVTEMHGAKAQLYLGVTDRAFRAYVRAGLIGRTGRGRSTRYVLDDVLRLRARLRSTQHAGNAEESLEAPSEAPG